MSASPKQLKYPIFCWSQDYISRLMSYQDLINSSRSTHRWLKEQDKTGKSGLIDASGTRYKVVDHIHIPSENILLRFLGSYKVEPVLADPKLLTLEEFKKQLIKAIMQRAQYYKYDTTLVKTKPKLEISTNYKDAIMALPKLY